MALLRRYHVVWEFRVKVKFILSRMLLRAWAHGFTFLTRQAHSDLKASLWLWGVQWGFIFPLYIFAATRMLISAEALVKLLGQGKRPLGKGKGLPVSLWEAPQTKGCASLWGILVGERLGPYSLRNYCARESGMVLCLVSGQEDLQAYVNTQTPVCTNVRPWHWQAPYYCRVQTYGHS